MTEDIKHGYQIIILPRQNGAYEAIITEPDGTTKRYTRHDLKRSLGQSQRKTEALQVAQEMLIAVRKAGDAPL
jgi:hypothetical protein